MPEPTRPVSHYDLCFGCGQANLFGLQLVDRDGRFFVKQDHQGPPGYAHGGVIAAALDEAMGLAVHAQGTHAVAGRLEVDFWAPAPVGTFVKVTSELERAEGRKLHLTARATGEDGTEYAVARGIFVESRLGDPG